MTLGYTKEQLNTKLSGFLNACRIVKETPFRMARKEMYDGPQHGWRPSFLKSECNKYQELIMKGCNVSVELLVS